jgi:uncharacterized protein YndB with AHSA1/START domain
LTTLTEPNRSVAHGVFTIERSYASVAPQRVFDAFASIEGKNDWFTAPNGQWDIVERTMDFRAGGRERLKGQWRTGRVTEFDATYYDIIPRGADRLRLRDAPGRAKDLGLAGHLRVQTSGGRRQADHDGAGAFLDGYDDNGSREGGSRHIIEKLSAYLEG